MGSSAVLPLLCWILLVSTLAAFHSTLPLASAQTVTSPDNSTISSPNNSTGDVVTILPAGNVTVKPIDPPGIIVDPVPIDPAPGPTGYPPYGVSQPTSPNPSYST